MRPCKSFMRKTLSDSLKCFFFLEILTLSQHTPALDHILLLRTDFRFVPSQWETVLLCNDVSHWLGTSLESALLLLVKGSSSTSTSCTGFHPTNYNCVVRGYYTGSVPNICHTCQYTTRISIQTRYDEKLGIPANRHVERWINIHYIRRNSQKNIKFIGNNIRK